MTPLVHGRIYGEIQSSALLHRDYRLLVTPEAFGGDGLSHLIQIDTLRQYLRSCPYEPCRVTLLSPAPPGEGPIRAGYEAFKWLGGELLPYGSVLTPEVAEVLGEETPKDIVALASAAVACDADFVVVPSTSESVSLREIEKKILVSFGDWGDAKRSCEIFVRGHEVPWAFSRPVWNVSWTPFYAIAEPDEKLVNLWHRAGAVAGAAGLDVESLELLRSLALNRHAALCYARDKLLFYRQQIQVAQRHKLKHQDFAFEAGYHLNHYYVLLSAGLDQISWITNGIFGLGFSREKWWEVGIRKRKFLARVQERAPGVHAIFVAPGFVRWTRILAGARNFAAHEGLTMPTEMYVRSAEEPTDAELDAEIDQTAEWQEVQGMFPPAILEGLRPQFRYEARLKRYQKLEARVMRIRVDGEEVHVYPLLNVEWDFDNFFEFAHNVADKALEPLSRH